MLHAEPLSCAVLSPDPEFGALVREAGRRHGLDVRFEPGVRYDRLAKHQLDQLEVFQPQLVFLDLGEDPRGGITFAQSLLENHPATHLVVAAADISPEILMTAMRAGVSEFLPKPVTLEALEGAIQGLRRKLGTRGAARREGRIFSFFSAKGGAGATTVATNFAIHLHRLTGRRTLLVDLDLELGEIALFLGVEPRFSVVDLASNLHRLDDGLLATFVQPHESGVDLLAAPWHPRDAERVSPEHVRSLLGFLRNRYDYVIADTSNSLTSRTLAVFEASDEVFIVSQVDVPSLRNIQRFRDILDDLRGEGRAIRLVVNRFGPGGEISLKDARAALGMDIYWVLSDDHDSVVHSMNTGRPLVMNVPSACSTEIEGLVGKVTGLEGPPPTRRRGLFAQWTSRFGKRRRRRTSARLPAPGSTGAGPDRMISIPPAAAER